MSAYSELYSVLSDDEKIMFKLKGERQYFDDLEIEIQQLRLKQIATLHLIEEKLAKLNKETKCFTLN